MSPLPPRGRWVVDPGRSKVAFTVRHLGMARVRGGFGEFEGVLEAGAESVSASGSVRVASISTGDSLRDRLLCGADFFDAERHGEITFASRAWRAVDGGLEIDGELLMAGAGAPLTLAVDWRQAPAGELALRASCELRRSEFGLRFRGAMAAGDRTVSDSVAIELALLAAAGA
jgi:polyisoprenoid-binding protein YceI